MKTHNDFTNRRRAVNDELKEQRRQAVLDSAWELFERTAYAEITMAQVAAAAGLAKGTVYLYFKTKEELFLAVLEQQFDAWFDRIDRQLQTPAGEPAPAAVARQIYASLEGRTAFIRLLAILHSLLEQNIDYAAAYRFKSFLQARLASAGELLEKRLPFLAAGQGARTLMRIYALLIGLQHLSDPAPVARRVLADPPMAAMRVDFQPEFISSVEALLYGLQYGTDNKE